MLKLEVDSLDGIDESIQSLYEEKDGKYRLKVDGIEDTGALKRAKDHEKKLRLEAEENARKIEQQMQELNDQIEAAKKDGHMKKGDVEALEKSWQEKYSKLEKDLSGKNTALNAQLQQLLVDKEAIRLASELAVDGSADILVPHIKARLSADEKDGKPVTVVTDAEGKPSAMTLDELKDEFSNNTAFAPIIVGSKASGSGGPGGGGGGGGKADLSKMTRAEKLDYYKLKRKE